YNKEYNYDLSFRDFISKNMEGFIERADIIKERIWILEVDKERRGSISIKKVNENVAQLGMFLVDPNLRGAGFGNQLVQTAIDFCRQTHYKTIILWTNNDLKAARHIYKNNGFRLIKTRKQTLSNQELLEELWELSI
ncbi:TPA: GNAT family N-acetyltransferase, partial [Bacillus cytotoxicus]|nr:GNAT family N-acetyltransferase [Bacillus cytotoxicus]